MVARVDAHPLLGCVAHRPLVIAVVFSAAVVFTAAVACVVVESAFALHVAALLVAPFAI